MSGILLCALNSFVQQLDNELLNAIFYSKSQLSNYIFYGERDDEKHLLSCEIRESNNEIINDNN